MHKIAHDEKLEEGNTSVSTYCRPDTRDKDDNVGKEDKEDNVLETPELLDSIDLSGLPILGNERSPTLRRLFWFLFIIGGLIYTLYYIVDQFIYYYSYPSSASVDIQFLSRIAFPTITVCNYNDIRSAVFRQAPPHPNGSDNLSTADLHHHLKATLFSNDVSWFDFYQQVAHQKNETIISCSWKDSGDCDYNNFTTHYTDMGVCYSFNKAPDTDIHVRQANELESLRIVLRVDKSQYANYTKVIGFKIVIHEPHSPALVKQQGLSLPVGYYSSIGLSRSAVQSLSKPWGRCEDLPLDHYKIYTMDACQEACLSDYIIASCGCREMYMKDTSVEVCSPQQLHSCVERHQKSYLQDMPSCQYSDADGNQCPLPCTGYSYERTFSMARFSDAYAIELSQVHGESAEYWMQNAMVVNIYFQSMFQEIVQHAPAYSTTSLLCDLGGALGLVLGASIVQVVQFLDWSVMTCYVRKIRR